MTIHTQIGAQEGPLARTQEGHRDNHQLSKILVWYYYHYFSFITIVTCITIEDILFFVSLVYFKSS